MDIAEIVVIVLSATIPVCIAYLLNARFQRNFALTEKLWDTKYNRLSAVEKKLYAFVKIATDVSMLHDDADDDSIDNASRFGRSIDIVQDLLEKNNSKMSVNHFFDDIRPDDFDKETANEVIDELIYLSLSWRLNLVDSIQEEFCGLSFILEDESIQQHSLDIAYSVTVFLGGIGGENFDLEAELDKISESVDGLDKKIKMELYRTRVSRLKPIKISKVD